MRLSFRAAKTALLMTRPHPRFAHLLPLSREKALTISILAGALLTFACRTAAPPLQLHATSTATRVILASFDGLGADGVAQFGAPAFDRMPLRVRRVVPVNPTVTSTTHVAILTGAGPDITGIVSNQFHRQGTPRDEVTKGLETEISAETLVEAAHRAGKRVGSIAFPTVDWSSRRRSADWGLAFTKPIAAAQLVRLTATDFHETTATHPSYSPAERANLAARDADIVAYDTTDDGVRNYDQLFVMTGNMETPIAGGGWFPVAQHNGDVLSGSWSRSFDSTAR